MLRRAEIAFTSLTAEAVEAKNHSPLGAVKALDLSRKMRQVPVEHNAAIILIPNRRPRRAPQVICQGLDAGLSCMTRVDMTSLTFVAEALVMAEPFHVHHEVSPFHVSILEWRDMPHSSLQRRDNDIILVSIQLCIVDVILHRI